MSLTVSCKLFGADIWPQLTFRWAADQAAKAKAEADAEVAATGTTKHKGSVANMSLGGGRADALDDAVNAAVEAGLHFAVAAGK